MTRYLAWLACLVTMGCAANPPLLSGPDLPARIRASVPDAQGELHVFENGRWYPFVDGFARRRESMLEREPGSYRGAVALTADAVLFVIWDRDLGRLDVAKRIAYADIRSVEVDRFGRRLELMVVRAADGSVHSFGFEGDPRRAGQAAALASSRLPETNRP
ncbi:MAG TPA: hypothetical protein VFP36_10095 [Usitatibacter sp.]|nr:hypothetical protein [Usitatibacter sp.]